MDWAQTKENLMDNNIKDEWRYIFLCNNHFEKERKIENQECISYSEK